MGVDTKALLNANVDVIQLANDIVELYGADRDFVSVRLTFLKDYFQIVFYHKNMPKHKDGFAITDRQDWREKNTRQMNVHYGCKGDYADITTDDCTLLSLGCWGESVEIMETLLKKYGGWIIRNDSTDDWEVFKTA